MSYSPLIHYKPADFQTCSLHPNHCLNSLPIHDLNQLWETPLVALHPRNKIWVACKEAELLSSKFFRDVLTVTLMCESLASQNAGAWLPALADWQHLQIRQAPSAPNLGAGANCRTQVHSSLWTSWTRCLKGKCKHICATFFITQNFYFSACDYDWLQAVSTNCHRQKPQHSVTQEYWGAPCQNKSMQAVNWIPRNKMYANAQNVQVICTVGTFPIEACIWSSISWQLSSD